MARGYPPGEGWADYHCTKCGADLLHDVCHGDEPCEGCDCAHCERVAPEPCDVCGEYCDDPHDEEFDDMIPEDPFEGLDYWKGQS